MIREFSAGGIVYKREALRVKGKGNSVLWLMAQHSQHKGWVFPKGFIGDKIDGESKEGTAIREVEEETGVKADITGESIKPVSYFYVWKGEKRLKTVYYFLMEYQSGDIKNHDFEMSEVIWLPTDKVLDKLTYKSDKEAFNQALEIFNNLPL